MRAAGGYSYAMLSRDYPVLERKTQLHTDILTAIEQAVMHAKFRPGQHLKEAVLAKEFRVSRGPIREVLHELERKGIAIRLPNRGTFVAKWSKKEIEDFYLFRMHTEGLSARLAALRRQEDDIKHLNRLVRTMRMSLEDADLHYFLDIDADFHYRIALAADCAPLLSTIATLHWRTRLLMAWDKGIGGSLAQFRNTADYHERIFEAIREGDATAAEAHMCEHISVSGKRLNYSWVEER
jgi:DNA-binding GntR family transcriptional regulator